MFKRNDLEQGIPLFQIRNGETDAKVSVEKGQLLFPADLVTGKQSYYSLSDGLGIIIVDHVIKKTFQLVSLPVLNEDYYVLLINCGSQSVEHTINGKKYCIGGNAASSLAWYSSAMHVSFNFDEGLDVKGIAIIVTRDYLMKNSLQYNYGSDIISQRDEKDVSIIDQEVHMQINIAKYELTQEILHYASNSNTFERFIIKANVLKILGLFIKRMYLSKSNNGAANNTLSHINEIDQIAGLKKLIEEYPESEHFSLDYLAKTVGMSKTVMKAKFKKTVGTSIYQYYQAYRMNKARDLLSSNADTITNIAYSLGFKTVSHFSRLFKKYHGINAASVVPPVRKAE